MLDAGDTIAAISSSAGSGARAIVRASGPDALALARTVFSSTAGVKLDELGGFRWAQGIVHLDGSIELPAVAYVFRAPRSYTRQDVVELHIPGQASVAQMLLDRLISAGAREATPGEFTARAFFNGRIDLSAAQAVADVINAAGETQLRSAMAALEGRLSRMCSEVSASLADVLAEVEASIDIADDPIDIQSPADLGVVLIEVANRLDRLAREAVDISQAGCLPHVVIAGRPNAGKSSLLNVLSGMERAIVSALAGTTRDILSAEMPTPSGVNVMLQDVAGLVDNPNADWISSQAQLAAQRAVSAADAIIFLFDLSDYDNTANAELLEILTKFNPAAPRLVVANKSDLAPGPARTNDIIRISCVTGLGIDGLKTKLFDLLDLKSGSSEAMGLHRRQKRALVQAADLVRGGGELLADAAEVSDVAELVSQSLRGALGELGTISGRIVNEDILGRIFCRFCVGK